MKTLDELVSNYLEPPQEPDLRAPSYAGPAHPAGQVLRDEKLRQINNQLNSGPVMNQGESFGGDLYSAFAGGADRLFTETLPGAMRGGADLLTPDNMPSGPIANAVNAGANWLADQSNGEYLYSPEYHEASMLSPRRWGPDTMNAIPGFAAQIATKGPAWGTAVGVGQMFGDKYNETGDALRSAITAGMQYAPERVGMGKFFGKGGVLGKAGTEAVTESAQVPIEAAVDYAYGDETSFGDMAEQVKAGLIPSAILGATGGGVDAEVDPRQAGSRANAFIDNLFPEMAMTTTGDMMPVPEPEQTGIVPVDGKGRMQPLDLGNNSMAVGDGWQGETGMPTYDDISKDPDYFRDRKGQKVRKQSMSPDEYIQRAAEGFGLTVDELVDSRSSDLINEYSEAMLKGDKFPDLMLDFFSKDGSQRFTQEGLHRAMAAKQAGIDQVPVTIRDNTVTKNPPKPGPNDRQTNPEPDILGDILSDFNPAGSDLKSDPVLDQVRETGSDNPNYKFQVGEMGPKAPTPEAARDKFIEQGGTIDSVVPVKTVSEAQDGSVVDPTPDMPAPDTVNEGLATDLAESIDPAGMLNLTHFSDEIRPVLDPKFAGTGADQTANARGREKYNMSWTGVMKSDAPYQPETDLTGGRTTHLKVDPAKLYNVRDNAALGKMYDQNDINGSIKRMQAAGYIGMRMRHPSQGDMVGLFNRTPTASQNMMGPTKPTPAYGPPRPDTFKKGPDTGAMVFSSPSKREDMSYEEAKSQVGKVRHKRYKTFSERVDKLFGKAVHEDAVGDWADGAENATVDLFPANPPVPLKKGMQGPPLPATMSPKRMTLEDVTASAAIKGLWAEQKMTIPFQVDDNGPDRVYVLETKADMDTARDAIIEAGLENRTLVPTKDGTKIMVYSQNDEFATHEAMEKLHENLETTKATYYQGQGKFLGDWSNRQKGYNEYKAELEKYISKGERLAGSNNLKGLITEALDAAKQHGLFSVPGSSRAMHNVRETGRQLLGKRDDKKNRVLAEKMDAAKRLIHRSDYSNKAVNTLANDMTKEMEYELDPKRRKKSGLGWYGPRVDKMRASLSNLISGRSGKKVDLNSPEHKGLFTAVLAITSDGTKLQDNLKSAMRTYSNYLDTGKLELQQHHGDAQKSMTASLSALTDLLAENGGDVQKMTEALLEEKTISQWKKEGKYDKGEYSADTPFVRAIIMGPKIGAFYANMMGKEDYLTMDRWWTRTVNRMRGELTETYTKAHLNRFKKSMKAAGHLKPDMTEDQLVEAALKHQKHFTDPDNRVNLSTVEDNLRKSANMIGNKVTKTLDAPYNASDRKFMRRVAQQVQRNLKAKGENVSIADIQAVMWFFEKRFYAEQGLADSKSTSFEEELAMIQDQMKDGSWSFEKGNKE